MFDPVAAQVSSTRCSSTAVDVDCYRFLKLLISARFLPRGSWWVLIALELCSVCVGISCRSAKLGWLLPSAVRFLIHTQEEPAFSSQAANWLRYCPVGSLPLFCPQWLAVRGQCCSRLFQIPLRIYWGGKKKKLQKLNIRSSWQQMRLMPGNYSVIEIMGSPTKPRLSPQTRKPQFTQIPSLS